MGGFRPTGGGGVPAPGSITNAQLANMPAGTVHANITGAPAAPQNVPYASLPWVLKAGDVMTGPLNVTMVGGLGPTDSNIVVQSNDPGVSGPSMATYHNSASPAASDVIFRLNHWGRDSANTDQIYGQMACQILSPTSGAENSRWFLSTVINGTFTNSFFFGQGLVVGSPSGGDMGPGMINCERLHAGGNVIALPTGAIIARMVTVGTLPSAGTQTAGARLTVSDANSTTFGSVVAGGGANSVPVYVDNGSNNWRIG